MKPFELLVFRNYSSLDEPVMSSPLGQISMRSGAIIGLFGAISLILYKTLQPTDITLAVPVLVPISIGLLLAMIKPQFGSADSILLSIFYMMQSRKKTDSAKMKSEKKKKKSTVLGFAKTLKKEKIAEEDLHMEINYSNTDELKKIKLNLSYPDGSAMAERLVKCYMDDDLFDTINTSLDGELALDIRPKGEGKRRLIIRDESDKIINQRVLVFKRK